MPPDWIARYPGPDHFWAHVVVLALDRPLTDVYWLNVNDPGFPFLVLAEHTNLMPPADYGGRHLVYLGNYLPAEHPLLRQTDEETLSEPAGGLSRLRPDFDPAWVTQSWVFKAPDAQPIVTTDYLDRLPPTRRPYRACTWPIWPMSTPRIADKTTACASASAWPSDLLAGSLRGDVR